MLRRIMSQGPDASKDAESAAKSESTQIEEPRISSNETEASGADQSNTAPSNHKSDNVDVSRRGSTERRKAARVKDEPLFPETEEALNVPKSQTIGMLSAMSTLTLICWFAARLACNAHPDQVREPKHYSTKDLAADPKNAAFEFHHSFETYDFTTALDLASGELKKLVENKVIECEKEPDVCAKKQATLAGTVNSTGRVLDEEGTRTTVELVSYYGKQLEPKTFQFVVEKQGDYYRVLSRRQIANAVSATAESVVPAASASVGASVPTDASASVPSEGTSPNGTSVTTP
jgi:hypothetical protein